MLFRILHIPSGNLYTTENSLATNKREFKKELKLAFIFLLAPIKKEGDIEELIEKTIKLWEPLGYNTTKDGILDWWVHDFVNFILEYGFITDMSEADTLEIPWETIIPSEFELMR